MVSGGYGVLWKVSECKWELVKCCYYPDTARGFGVSQMRYKKNTVNFNNSVVIFPGPLDVPLSLKKIDETQYISGERKM